MFSRGSGLPPEFTPAKAEAGATTEETFYETVNFSNIEAGRNPSQGNLLKVFHLIFYPENVNEDNCHCMETILDQKEKARKTSPFFAPLP